MRRRLSQQRKEPFFGSALALVCRTNHRHSDADWHAVFLFAFLLVAGGTLGEMFGWAWGTFVSPPIQAVVTLVLVQGLVGKVALWGLDAGIEARTRSRLAYVLTFYAVLAILEDSGYMKLGRVLLRRGDEAI